MTPSVARTIPTYTTNFNSHQLSVASLAALAQPTMFAEAEEHVTTLGGGGGDKQMGQPGVVEKFLEFHVYDGTYTTT